MRCEICGMIGKHNTRCPNYVPPKATHYCSTCGQGIYCEEEYIKNDDGEYRHLDCIFGLKDLIQWFGYEIQIMEDPYEEENF